MVSRAKRSIFFVGLVCIAAVLAGCGRGEVKVYQLSNNDSGSSAAPNTATAAADQNDNSATQPQLQWTLPQGWTEVAPGEMSVASFKVTGQNGADADVSVVPLPGSAGGDAANVNRWRSQMGLAAASPDEIDKSSESVQVGDQPGKLYDIAGQSFDSGNSRRILGTIGERDGMTWFFKMTGDANLVEQQKPEFIAFLKSLKFTAGTRAQALPPGHPSISGGDMSAPMASAGGESQAQPQWTVPTDWHSVPPAQFLAAEYSIAGANGTTAEVNVAQLNGTGGGVLPNVNRWRGQIGLEPVDETALAKLATTIAVTGGQATFVDMTGADANGRPTRLVAAIVPEGGQTWFYKLMGNQKVVESQKDAFTKFVQSARYSNAP